MVQRVHCCWRPPGWIRWQCQISDINQQPPLLLLSSCVTSSSVLPISFQVFLPLSLSSAFLQPCTPTQGSGQADRAGFVMNGILLHIRRKCTLQRGSTNCLHCPGNDSVDAAVTGSQPGRQRERQAEGSQRHRKGRPMQTQPRHVRFPAELPLAAPFQTEETGGQA